MKLIALILSFIAISSFLYKRGTKVDLSDVFRKSVASLSFIFVAIVALRIESDGIMAFITMGLVSALLGDIFLDLKYAYPSDEKYFLPAGIISFSITHCFYIYAFMKDGNLFSFLPIALMCITFIFSIILITITEEKMKLDFDKNRPLVVLYTAIVSVSTITSFIAAVCNPESDTVIRASGMLMFFISDLLLSFIYFRKIEKEKIMKILIFFNHLTYYVGQLLIASSLNF